MASPYSERPPRFDYRLTADGAALADSVRLLGAWATARVGVPDPPAHEPCGTPLEVRWWCPSCHEVAQPLVDETILA